ncbi:MAG: hypothetical protein CVU84_05195 [Firmicutes bacterium HGW-Firmicutes-1]|jgi:uncharacterized membrane protein YheB (UPF0754 family)|nr:MAG: hypothetical protein CVU84_05195 [Firmicutes bacterium HGW-Firmicutes-1]
MNYSDIATPIVGAIIGYTTNWIAIKMLFKPYKEKRIFGIKVPFTPGLIAKERERITMAMGEVVEQYLLTDEVILKELTSDTIGETIVSFFEAESHIKEGALNLSLLFKNREEIEQFSRTISRLAVEKIVYGLKDTELQNKMIQLLKEQIIKILGEKTIKEIATQNKEILQLFLDQLINSDGSIDLLANEIELLMDEDKSIEELLGQQLMKQIQNLVSFNEPKIKDAINHILISESFAEKAKDMITAVISSKFGALGSMFVNAGSIYESIVATVNENIETTEISKTINEYIAMVIQKPLGEIAPEQSRKEIARYVAQSILNKTLIDKVSAYIYNMDKTPLALANAISSGSLEEVVDEFSKYIYSKLKDNVNSIKPSAEELTMKLIEQMIYSPIQITPEGKSNLSKKVLELYHFVIKKYVIKLIGSVKISSIVEKQINSFEIEIFEEVILTIAKKELRAITWLGGLLGFIMSVILLIIK